MNKNKILSPFNIFFGVMFSLMPILIYVFVIMPQIELLEKFGGQNQNEIGIYTIFGLMLAMGLGNLFLGYKLLKDKNSNSVFKLGLIIAIGSFIGFSILSAFATTLITTPIYEMTRSF